VVAENAEMPILLRLGFCLVLCFVQVTPNSKCASVAIRNPAEGDFVSIQSAHGRVTVGAAPALSHCSTFLICAKQG